MQRDVKEGHADMRGDLRGGAEPPVEEVSPKNTVCRERLRVVSYRHARRAQGADPVRFRAAGRSPPRDRDAQGNPQAGLLLAGAVRAGLVPGQGRYSGLGAGFGGHRGGPDFGHFWA
jgi:hypothetical protein